MTKSETDILQECRLAASEYGAIMWRNNTGMLKDDNGRPIRYGLCVGSSDLIGIFNGRFVAAEVKKPGWKPSGAAQLKHWQEQLNFIDVVNKAGGIAGVVHSADDVRSLLNKSQN